MCDSIEDGGHRCPNCGRKAAEAKLTSAEACASRALAKAQALNGGSALFLTPPEDDDDDELTTEDGSSLHRAPEPTPALKPGAARKRLRELLDMLRGAAARRSAARRALAAQRVEAEQAAEIDAAALRVDELEAEHELELIAQAQDDAVGVVGGKKQAMEYEAEACELASNRAATELALIVRNWRTPQDDKEIRGQHTKAWERRALLQGQPVMTNTWPVASVYGEHETELRKRNAKHELAQIRREWLSPRDDKVGANGKHTARYLRREQLRNQDSDAVEAVRIEAQWSSRDEASSSRKGAKLWARRVALVGAPALAMTWTDPNAPASAGASRGELGRLKDRATAARKIASTQPSATQRAERVAAAANRVAFAKIELDAIKDWHGSPVSA